jgi:hypothetical protein
MIHQSDSGQPIGGNGKNREKEELLLPFHRAHFLSSRFLGRGHLSLVPMFG